MYKALSARKSHKFTSRFNNLVVMKYLFITLYAGLLGFAQISFAYTADSAVKMAVPVSSVVSTPQGITLSISGVVGKPFILDGTKSQDDGVIQKFLWVQVEGPKVALPDATLVKLSVVPAQAGTYVFDLQVTDAIGLVTPVQRVKIGVGDPDFDLIKVSPPTPTPTPTTSVVNPLYDVKNTEVLNPLHQSPDKTVAPSPSIVRPTTGDPDFDLKITPKSTSPISDPDRDGYPDVLTGKAPVTPPMTGDPDFDQFNIQFDEDADNDGVPSMDEDISENRKVTVRGWDVEKKEVIAGQPELVKSSGDLRLYAEAVTIESLQITKVKIDKSLIEVDAIGKGKLFWFIPIEMESRIVIKHDDTMPTDDTVIVDLPWWSIFVNDDVNEDQIKSAVTLELTATLEGSVSTGELGKTVTRISRALNRLSNVLKSKHDTVKNSISNVR